MFKTAFTGLAMAAVLAISTSAHAGLIGQSFTLTSTSIIGSQTTSSTIIDPGAEISFGDANAPSWMVAGDAIDFGPSTNPIAPTQLHLSLGSTHNFIAGQDLVLTFDFGPNVDITGIGAITEAATVNLIGVVLDPQEIVLTIHDMYQVSFGDFGGGVTVKFQTVPAPGTLALLGFGLFGIGGMRRKLKAA